MEQMTGDVLTEVVDARSNPELANALAAEVLSEAESGKSRDLPDPPMPRSAPSLDVELPTGSHAVIRELTGADEEKIAKINAKDFLWRRRAALVRAGLVELDGEPVGKDFPDLTVADREALLLAIRIATYGPELDMEITCPKCEEANEVTINLDEIEVRPQGEAGTDVTLRDGGVLSIVYPRASDEDNALKMAVKGRTGAEINTRFVAECVVSDSRGPWLGDISARNMGLGDRKAVIDAITSTEFGPNYDDLEAECTNCGHRASLDVTLADMFRG